MRATPIAEESGGWTRRLGRWVVPLLCLYWNCLFAATHWPDPLDLQSGPGVDKVWHLAAYMVLGCLASAAVDRRWGMGRWQAVGLVLVLAVYGVVDELLQIPVGRDAELLDWVADVVGILLGVAAYFLLRRAAEMTALRSEI